MKRLSLQKIKAKLANKTIVKKTKNIKGGLRVFSTHNYQEYVDFYYQEVCDKGYGHNAMQTYSSQDGYTVCYDW